VAKKRDKQNPQLGYVSQMGLQKTQQKIVPWGTRKKILIETVFFFWKWKKV